MKVLYTTDKFYEDTKTIYELNQQKDWKVIKSPTDAHTMMCCTKHFYDVLVIDLDIPNFDWRVLIRNLRDKQIFTPILTLSNKEEYRLAGMKEGADMCLIKPFTTEDIMLCIRTLKRRNANYQSPLIAYGDITLNRPDGKISSPHGTLSVGPIEIEIFRLLTRATAPITIEALSDKIMEPTEKILFFAKCLKQKIDLLNSTLDIVIKNNKCRLIEREVKIDVNMEK
jgi:DNA-binding response OmpR family regulator